MAIRPARLPYERSADMKRACVIGGGFGGLALAIRLQAGGIATTLVEARGQVGGCAQGFARDGFTFDTHTHKSLPLGSSICQLHQLSLCSP